MPKLEIDGRVDGIDDQAKQRQRQPQSHDPVAEEGQRPAPPQDHQAEEPGKQEERRHAPLVDPAQQHQHPILGLRHLVPRHVDGFPDLWRDKGQRRVQHHTQRHGDTAQEV